MLYKKPNSKYWICKFELSNGSKRVRINRSTKETTKKKAEQVEAHLRQVEWDKLVTPQFHNSNWERAEALYLDSRRTNRTIDKKQAHLKWWREQLKVSTLNEITSSDILTAISKRNELSVATKNRYLSEIKCFLNFVHKELGWLQYTPYIRLNRETSRPFMRLTNDDVVRMIKAAPPYMKPIIFFAISTGLRMSNIINLMWYDIDLQRGLLTVEAEDHKSQSRVVHPLCESVRSLLIKLKNRSQSPFVFTNDKQKKLLDLNRRVWYRICEKANLEGLRFHDLRHNWASRHAEAGTDIIAIKELGGWKTLGMVQRYTHPSIDYLHRQAQNIEAQTSDLGRLFNTKNVTANVTRMAENRLTCDKLPKTDNVNEESEFFESLINKGM